MQRFIAASSCCAIRDVPNQLWRCMPRWLSTGLRTTRGEGGRVRAEGAFPAAGSPSRLRDGVPCAEPASAGWHACGVAVRLKPDTTYGRPTCPPSLKLRRVRRSRGGGGKVGLYGCNGAGRYTDVFDRAG